MTSSPEDLEMATTPNEMATTKEEMATTKENKDNPATQFPATKEQMSSTQMEPLPSASDSGSICQSISKGVFIFATALVVILALRNSLQWHISKVWRASDDFWTGIWGRVCQMFGDDFFAMQVYGTVILETIVFWLANSLLLLLDNSVTPLSMWFRQFKIQEDQNVPVDPKKLRKCVKQVLFNQFFVTLPFLALVHPVLVWRGMSASRELPDFHWSLLQLAFCVLVEEICFYYAHRLLHHPRIYKYVHKVHHEWTAPIGVVSIYCHPIEHILSNVGPLVLGVFVSRCHLATAWFWYGIAILQTTISHSGYHFPLLPSPEAHDFHHHKFNQNFGVLGILDRLHGTDSLFRRSKAYNRHVMFFSLTPISSQFPDDKKTFVKSGKEEREVR